MNKVFGYKSTHEKEKKELIKIYKSWYKDFVKGKTKKEDLTRNINWSIIDK
jgi:hypothetical protein